MKLLGISQFYAPKFSAYLSGERNPLIINFPNYKNWCFGFEVSQAHVFYFEVNFCKLHSKLFRFVMNSISFMKIFLLFLNGALRYILFLSLMS